MARFIVDIDSSELKNKEKMAMEICDFLNKKYGTISVNLVTDTNDGQFHLGWGTDKGDEGQPVNDNQAVEVLKSLMVVQEVERKERALTDDRYK